MDEQPTEPKLTQIDATLEHLGRLCARLEQAEQRFKQMTDECGSVLDGLVSVDRRHATTLATLNDRLGDWCSIERKLLEESARRIHRFERGVEHEWTALRTLHEAPISDLRDQADKLRLACLEAATLARQRLDAAEQGYVMQTADLERRLAEWSRRMFRDAGRAITDGSAAGPGDPGTGLAGSAPEPVEPWPLEGVAQLHHELRTAVRPGQPPTGHNGDARELPSINGDGDRARASASAAPPPVRVETTDFRLAPDASLLPSPSGDSRRRAWPMRVGVAVIVGLLGLVVVLYVSQQQRLRDLEAAAKQTARQMQAAHEAARAKELSKVAVSPAASRAATIVEILAAPDLWRYVLAGFGPGQGAAYGQVLWSRSHGLAVTTAGLPQVAGKVYRVWVAGDGRTASAGVLEFDGPATAALLVAGSLTLPRPAFITVNLEDAVAADRPTGPVYLVRASGS